MNQKTIRPVTGLAERLAVRLADSGLIIESRQFGGHGNHIVVAKPGVSGGIVFHPDQIDNGAAGFREEALERIEAFRAGVPYVAQKQVGLDYTDVMTLRHEHDKDISE